MMSASIRRKALSLCSSALANNICAQPALAGGSAARGYVAGNPMFEAFVGSSKLVPGIHQGAPVYSKPLRDTDFPIQKWIRSFSSYSESAVRGEPLAQVQTDKGSFAAEIEKTVNKRTHTGPAFFTASGAAVVGSILTTPIVNVPQAGKLGMGSTVSSTFVPNLALFWHMNNGIEEILADYVHHEMTRSLILVLMRLFLIVAAKDVFVATN